MLATYIMVSDRYSKLVYIPNEDSLSLRCSVMNSSQSNVKCNWGTYDHNCNHNLNYSPSQYSLHYFECLCVHTCMGGVVNWYGYITMFGHSNWSSIIEHNHHWCYSKKTAAHYIVANFLKLILGTPQTPPISVNHT